MLISKDAVIYCTFTLYKIKYLFTATFYGGVNYWYTGTEQFML